MGNEEGTSTAGSSMMRWPPPGLERMQGDLGSIMMRGALSGLLLVLPILFVTARSQQVSTLGPFADAWWIAILLATVGLAFTLDALVRTARLLRRSAAAVGQGYDLTTVLHVAADTGRDMGFLLIGARHFEDMDEVERGALARIRVFGVLLHTISVLWLPIGLGLGLLLASRDVLTPVGLGTFTLLPAAIALILGGVGRLVVDSRTRRARKAYYKQPWAADLANDAARAWREAALNSAAGPTDESVAASQRTIPVLRTSWIFVVGITVVVVVPILTLMPSSTIGPILALVSAPSSNNVMRRAAVAEAYRAYVVEADPAISAQEAGRLFHDLTYAGVNREIYPAEREAGRELTQPWLPDTGEENPMGVDPARWGEELIGVVAAGTTGAQRAYLAQVATHPDAQYLSRLATAARIDVASARWVSPLPPELTLATMPVPRYGQLRSATRAHIGAAAYALSEGDAASAERLIAEVISVGFLLSDQAPTLIDNLIGYALISQGGRALEDLFEATDPDRHAALLQSRQVAERAADHSVADASPGGETWLRSLPTEVLDSTTVRGLRWEYFIGVTTLTPCLNLHRMVFGPSAEYEDFVAAAHDSLVEWPSEEGLFELANVGYLGTLHSEGESMIGRFLSISMARGSGACGELIRTVETAQALF